MPFALASRRTSRHSHSHEPGVRRVTLIDRFLREGSNEIDYEGRRVHSAYLVPDVADRDTLRVRLVSGVAEPVQGIQVHIRRGTFSVAG